MNLILQLRCIICLTQEEVIVKEEDYDKWQDGTPIQDAMPYLNVDKREFLISGLCPKCFEILSSEEE